MPTRREPNYSKTTQQQKDAVEEQSKRCWLSAVRDEVFRGLSAMMQKGGCNSARGETQDTEVRELDVNLHRRMCKRVLT